MYDQIARNRRDTKILLGVLFVLFLALGYALGVFLPFYFGHTDVDGAIQNGATVSTRTIFPMWHGWVGAGVAAMFWMGAVMVAWFGGRSILLSAGGAQPADATEHAQLYNVVAEMAIAAGVPPPRVYVIPDPSPNAFATGPSPDRAAIAVTTGLLQKLNRDELQGVVAHEMAHIRNFDTRLLMLMTILVGGLALLLEISRPRTYRYNRRQEGITLFVLFAISALLAKVVQMAVSRRREYLADATSALITRYPTGLASALEKIARDPAGLLRAGHATAHLYIIDPCHGQPTGSAMDGMISLANTLDDRSWKLFSTHPPVGERLRRLQAMGAQPSMTASPPTSAPAEVPAAAAWNAPAAPLLPLDMEPTARRLAREVLTEAQKPTIRQLGPSGPIPVAIDPPSSPGQTVSRALPEGPTRCPRCQEAMLPGRIHGFEALGCRHCGGVWMPQAGYEQAMRENPDVLDAADRRFPNLVGVGWDLMHDRMCPICGLRLLHHKIDEPVGVDLDRCPDCRGLWFDDGELSALAWAGKRKPLRGGSRQS